MASHAQRPILRRGLATNSSQAFAAGLTGLDRQGTGFATVFVMDARGVMRFHDPDPSLVGEDFSHRDYYQGVLRTGRPYVSAPYIGRATKQPTVAVAAPVRDGTGRLQGLLAGTLTLQTLSHMAARLPGAHRTHVMLVGPGGVILTHNEAWRVMQSAGTSNPAIPQVLRDQSGWEKWTDPQGTPQFSVFAPIRSLQRRYLGHIHQAGKHLLGIINDILDLSKAEAGQFTLSPEAVPLGSTLEAALVIVKGVAGKKHLHLGLHMDDALGTVWADPVRLKQMLYNLLSNAVKFTPEHGRVTVTARRVEAGLEIAVSDTGIGIRAEDLPRLFTEFSQLGPQRHEGTGLGLALTKRLVELHGGSIGVESAHGKGSTFTLTLPERALTDRATSRDDGEAPLACDRQPKAA